MKFNPRMILLAIAGFLVIGAIVLVIVARSGTNNNLSPGNGNNNPSAFPSSGSRSNPTGNANSNIPSEKFTMPSKDDPKMKITANGADLEVNNVFRYPIKDLSDGGVTFTENDNFISSFYPEDQGFIITITNPNIQQGREEAEQNFLFYLGITKEQACKLRVDLGVPAFVNGPAAGKNYGLSFCPNGKPFPGQ